MWWYTPVIPALARLSQDDLCAFEASLNCVAKFCLKKAKKKAEKKRDNNKK